MPAHPTFPPPLPISGDAYDGQFFLYRILRKLEKIKMKKKGKMRRKTGPTVLRTNDSAGLMKTKGKPGKKEKVCLARLLISLT